MKRSERLGQLREALVAERKMLDERVASVEVRAQQAVRRLEELQRYREEYVSGFASRAAAGIGGAGLRDYQAFLARLDEAVRQQQQIAARIAAELEFERQHWRDAAVRVRAVEVVGERWRAEETRESQRREQRECDERARTLASGPGSDRTT